MKKWLDEVSTSLDEAIKMAERENIALQSLYRLAPALFALKHGIQDGELIQQMLDEADSQVTQDASYDARSWDQYKFHYVSSYLFCYVVNEELEELEYDRVFEYVNERMDLFTDDYGIE
tara:strand:+ start:72 stop:428 length:357 start_codon:yes stop_codon:yes gene_type:complete